MSSYMVLYHHAKFEPYPVTSLEFHTGGGYPWWTLDEVYNNKCIAMLIIGTLTVELIQMDCVALGMGSTSISWMPVEIHFDKTIQDPV